MGDADRRHRAGRDLNARLHGRDQRRRSRRILDDRKFPYVGPADDMASCDRIESAGSEGLEEIGLVVSEFVGTEDKSILAKHAISEGRRKRALASDKEYGIRVIAAVRNGIKSKCGGKRAKSQIHEP